MYGQFYNLIEALQYGLRKDQVLLVWPDYEELKSVVIV